MTEIVRARRSVRERKRAQRPVRSMLKLGYRDMRALLPAHGASSRMLEWFDLYGVDHGVFRAVYANRHAVDPLMGRMAQPSPRHIAGAARAGVKTVINLRGARNCGSYRLEQAACAAAGIALVDFPLRSRGAPDAATLAEAWALFARIEYPALMHCKSGADRAGLMAALYLIWRGVPVAQAARQLSWRFGHISAAETGILDHVFALYAADGAAAGLGFAEWAETRYSARYARDSYRSSGLANFVSNRLLRRE